MVNWNDYFYGTQNAKLPTTTTVGGMGPSQTTTDYNTLYQQAQSGNFSNFRANQTGFAPGSANWLQTADASGRLQFDALAPRRPKPEDNLEQMALAGMEQTLGDVRQSAYQDYMARQLQQLELQKQGAMLTGADRFQQARLAMEQQRGLSDTRGLTAGAAVGAQGQLGAQQQLVLNSIERGTMDDLRQLESQGITAEFAANEWANQKVQEFMQTDESWRNVDAAGSAVETAAAAYDRNPESPELRRAYDAANIQYYRALAAVSGLNFDDIILDIETQMEGRTAEDIDFSEIFTSDTIEMFETALERSQPRGLEAPGEAAIDIAIPAAVTVAGARSLVFAAGSGGGLSATALTGGSTTSQLIFGKNTAKWVAQSAQTSRLASSKLATKGLGQGILNALKVGKGAKEVTLTAKGVQGIKNVKTLGALANKLGISAKAIKGAKTAAGLQKLILAKAGLAGKGSILAAKLAFIGKGAVAIALAKPLLIAAAVGATIVAGVMVYNAAKKHFGPEIAKEQLNETLEVEREMLQIEGMDSESADNFISTFKSQFPDLNL